MDTHAPFSFASRRGRPRTVAEAYTSVAGTMLSATQRAALEARAKAAGTTVSGYLRALIIADEEREAGR